MGHEDRVIRDFAEHVCPGYTTLMHAQASHYRNWLKDVLGDAQAHGEYLGGLLARVGENRHSLHHGDDGSDKERGGPISPPEARDPRRVAVVVALSTCSL